HHLRQIVNRITVCIALHKGVVFLLPDGLILLVRRQNDDLHFISSMERHMFQMKLSFAVDRRFRTKCVHVKSPKILEKSVHFDCFENDFGGGKSPENSAPISTDLFFHDCRLSVRHCVNQMKYYLLVLLVLSVVPGCNSSTTEVNGNSPLTDQTKYFFLGAD